MIINGQTDVLRIGGEAFGEKLRCAGVKVTAVRGGEPFIMHLIKQMNAVQLWMYQPSELTKKIISHVNTTDQRSIGWIHST